uniref:zonadhesin-like isoform X1 n=1 Tax=Styela clava TaxID=7725 RepID=UPI001939EF5F|nr:zonadhesin-like isoform X1 [Styela clava]
MLRVTVLLLMLGSAQHTFGQFFETDSLRAVLGELDESSGDDGQRDLFDRDDIIKDTPGRCGDKRFGNGCDYTMFDYNPVVPMEAWKDDVPGNRAMCSVFGRKNIITFDNAYAYHGSTCETLMARLCDDDQSPSVWLTRSIDCDDCISEVRLSYLGHELVLNDDVLLDKKSISSRMPLRAEDVEIYYENGDIVAKSSDYGTELRYNRDTSTVYWFSPKKYARETCGLCGNMDGEKSNDVSAEGIPVFLEKSHDTCHNKIIPDEIDPAMSQCMKHDSTRRICNILISEVFRTCLTVVDPTPFYAFCLHDICKGDVHRQGDLLCNITAQYSRQCSIRKGSPSEWRSEANCVVESCPDGFQWNECVASSRTCAMLGNEGEYAILGFCNSGCECIEGTFLQEGKCVAAEECKCEQNGEFFEPSDRIDSSCNNTCTCSGGKWICTENTCNGVATAIGMFRYTTFDGQQLQYLDACSHIFAKDCGNGDFEVILHYEERNGFYYKYVTVNVQFGDKVVSYTLRRDSTIEVDGELVTAPYKKGIVEIQSNVYAMVLKIIGKDVVVKYDRMFGVYVIVPPTYSDKMCGIAGNYNGLKGDDKRLKSKFISKTLPDFFGDWKTDRSCLQPVGSHVCRVPQEENICNLMFDFSSCSVTYEAVEACSNDLCYFTESVEMSRMFACSTSRTLINVCEQRKSIGIIPVQPFDIEECEGECPEGLEYRESSTCADSCSSFNNLCASVIQLSCFCPEGTYRNDLGVCVPKEECPCLHDGSWYKQGEITTFINLECSCFSGEMTCNEINETIACPSPDMVYHSCEDTSDFGAACEKTCRDGDQLCVAGACMPGCTCKPGLYRTDENTCVPKETCGCYAGDKYYKHGESFKDDCNTVTCMGGTFTQTDLICPRSCWAVGASHYKSFDGLRYDFEGDCEYVLATDYCPNNPNGGLFSVHTKNTRCGSHGMTCSKALVVTVKNQKITVERGSEPVIETIPGTRFRRAITGFTDHETAGTFTIKQKGIFTVIDTCIGMTVLWDNKTRIYIRLTEEFQGTTCGMCGNYDGKDDNDLKLSTGLKTENVINFGNSWKFPLQTTTCPDSSISTHINASCTDISRKEWAINKCRTITQANGLFSDCHSTVDPQEYFDICVHDACGCDGGGDCECLCSAIAHYAHTCADNGIPIEWRSNNLCPIMCEQYNDNEDICLWHYRPCATCITDTCCDCQQPEDTHWCVEGCFPKCPDGYILDEMTQRCILETERDSQCTWYTTENMCHTCKKCEVCKTKSGAQLRVTPGQTIYFPVATDACEREWCAMDTTGDLCYNGTINWYDCKEEYKPIPSCDPTYYTQICSNSTTSKCSNCRDCECECKLRNDSCEAGKTSNSSSWKKVFPVIPTPEKGAKTYCIKYTCENHPVATEPQCFIQREERVTCEQSITDVICKEHEVLKVYPTGDECCPEKYECVCEVCALDNNGVVEYIKAYEPGVTNEWCEDESTSNCCYTDTCTVDAEREDKTICPIVTRTQAPCTTGPAPTCTPGFVWRNLTRADDCCPWGECECDSCYDYDASNNRNLKLIGDQWNKKCMKFRCVRGVRDATGCFRSINYENVTCAKKPICKSDEYVKIVGIDEWECCDIYDCVCYDQCRVTIGGTERIIDPGQEIRMDDGCWYTCVDPRTSEEDKNCPRVEKTCHAPTECEECEYIAKTVNDTCGCKQYDCQPVERCPSIDCPFPYVRVIDPSGDKCKEPCYDCECKECWDQIQNRTYQIGKEWKRQVAAKTKALTSSTCEDCVCTDAMDDDGCMKEHCTPTPCPPVEECESPYDVPIHSENECGCTILLGCKCPHCMYDGKIIDGKEPGDTWNIGNLALGCYDSYQCLAYRNPGMSKECFNITKVRNPCVVNDECPDDHVAVKSEVRSCDYDDGEHCPKYDCTCVKCRFGGKSYNPGDTWTKDCINYHCTNETDSADPAKCKKITSEVVDCPATNITCTECHVQYLKQKREVPDHCCDIWDCKPEPYCYDEGGVKHLNGSIWEPDECRRVQCFVSEEDYPEKCPEIIDIDHCDPDPTVCNECQNKTVKKDKCGCDYTECPPNDPPVSCDKPASNQIIDFFNTANICYPSKNCCVCDDACYHNGVRKSLFTVWKNKATCQRLRCVLPEATLTALKFDPKRIDFDDLEDVTTWSQIISKLNYRKMMSNSIIPKSLYSECSQDVSLCPITYDLGCEKPKDCGECETTTETVDECGCPIVTCTPYVCPPAPYDVKLCTEPKVVMKNISLEGLTELYPCCKQGRQCVCRDGCEDKNGTIHPVGESWDEIGTNECGKTLTKKTCRAPAEFPDPKPECPEAVKVPCDEPITCGNCENRTSYIDEYCCEIASCKPLNEPTQCIEPKLNQRHSTLETGDECFPSKECCVCDTTCTYKGATYQLFEVWKDTEACTRMRCILPETTIRHLGYTGKIDFENLADTMMEATFSNLKTKVDYRKMLDEKKIPHKLYEECQQNVSLCPTSFDIGCEPVEKCLECFNTTITKDSCGCDVSTCTLIERCPNIKCDFPYRPTEIKDADPCKAPCYECTCDHTCVDDVTNSTYDPGTSWERTIMDPRSCESCICTDDKDEKDGCLKEKCMPIPCPVVEKCEAPYNKAVYGKDDCGCKKLISCECTQCMLDGEIVANKSAGESWTKGDVDRGCYDTYYCNPIKKSGEQLECYEVKKTRKECTVDSECPEDYVPIKNEDRSCCYDGTCCPRYDCMCVKCRFNGKSYNPGEKWTKDCIDYTCTNVTDEADPAKCKKVESQESPCNETKEVCKDCFVEYLAVKRDVANGECCNIWGCKAEKVCIKDGARVPNGTIWVPKKCVKLECYVSEEDWNKEICPIPRTIDHCENDLTIECPPCTTKKIIKDECDCDKVSCPPIEEPTHCSVATKRQIITTLETKDTCFPSKNCCMCDSTCYFKGVKKDLFSVWIDESTCQRMRCVAPESLLTKLGYDLSVIDFKDTENVAFWSELRSKIDFRRMMTESNIATKLYEECSQDMDLCPVARDIGCPEPQSCPNCTNTIKSEDACGCTVHTCSPFKCPPSPYDVKECSEPKSNLVEISLNGLSDKYPCCSVGRECTCHKTCFDYQNQTREIGETWDEPLEYACTSDPSVAGSIVRKVCRAAKPESTELSEICPHTHIVPCDEPIKCGPCEEEIKTLDDRCCAVITCKKIECDINTLDDCELPKIALKSDATVTGDECCPKYCDCPDKCLESETAKKYDRNLEWPHPLDACYTRKCLVDPSKNLGCPYIINNTICTEPKECDACYTALDTTNDCGCTERVCERNPCPTISCENECEEVYQTEEVDSCNYPVFACRPKSCPPKITKCTNPEEDVYSWMDLSINKCCKQQGCRCNYTKCVEPSCPSGQVPVRNVSATKCCCPEYMCVPDDDQTCVDYNGMRRKVGVPWINKDNKCKMLQCSYSNTKTRNSYKIEEFDRFICSSEKPSCVNGGTAYLASTKEGCCREWVCPCTCEAYGDPHFTTFDGFSYNYQGKCTYTLMKEYAFNETEVIIDNELCRWFSARRKSLSCLKTLTVIHKTKNYTLTFGQKFLFNGKEIKVREPWTSDNGEVTVREFGYKKFMLTVHSLNLQIIYKTRTWEQSLILTVPFESLEGKMLGLCGTCNNDPSDEFKNKLSQLIHVKDEEDQEAIDKFGESWIKGIPDYDQPKCFPLEPECPEESEFPDCGELPPDVCINCDNKCHLIHPKCNPCETNPCQVLATKEVYREARSHIDPRVYIAKCAFDLSLESNMTKKCNACFSSSVAQYASINEMHGLCIPWRSALNCDDMMCPHPSQEYRECDLDAKRDLSCDTPVLNVTGSLNVAGCFCPEGMIRKTASSEECVPIKCCSGCAEPPKYEDGTVSMPGEDLDECGCPVYVCAAGGETSGCQVKTERQPLEVNIDGVSCASAEAVESAYCVGNCAVSTRSTNGGMDSECSTCNPISTDTKSVTVLCSNGEMKIHQHKVITACECASFQCPETEFGVSGDDRILGSGGNRMIGSGDM